MEQPKTLRLAYDLEKYDICSSIEAMPDFDEVAAELRRLHDENLRLRGIVPEALEKLNDELCDENDRLRALNQELLKALRYVTLDCENVHHEKKDRHSFAEPCPVIAKISAVIAKTEGEKQ